MSMSSSSPIKHAAPKRRRDSARGIAAMAAGMFLYAAVDTQAKLLTETLHPLQIVWFRQLGLLTVVFVLLAMKGPRILRSNVPGLQIARGILAALSAGLFIAAITYVPLADAVTVSFIAPFLVTLLGAWILGEAIGLRRWAAVTLGFVGTLIVIRPGMGAMHAAVLLVVVAAILFALRQILSRLVSNQDHIFTTLAYTAIASSALLTLALPFVWEWPSTGQEWALLCGAAALAAVAEILIIRAAVLAEAVVIAPVQYTLLLWGTLYGFLIFGDLPDFWTWIGAALIVATGLYTLSRERRAELMRRESSNTAK